MGIINQNSISYMKEYFEINDDKLVKHTPIAVDGIYDGICKYETIITKDAFLECYKKWVLQEGGGE